MNTVEGLNDFVETLSTSTDLGIFECSTTNNCAVLDLGNMTNTQCCIENSAGRTYTRPGSDSECHTCIGKLDANQAVHKASQ